MSGSLLAARADDADASGTAGRETDSGISWAPLIWQSLFFTGVEHGFRLATQSYTRDALYGRFFPDWGASIGNLHGWADGDPFLINYIGHPMQGAVSGYIFVQNDTRYKRIEFGRNREYWKGRLWATAFSFAFSEHIEIGPVSEASIGNAQAYYPQVGFVDHVITPGVGLAWMIGEDAIDKYFIKRIENRIRNKWLKMSLRAGLNPSRAMANAMRLQVPWHRDTRPGIFRGPVVLAGGQAFAAADHDPDPDPVESAAIAPLSDLSPSLIPTFELGTTYSYFQLAAGKRGSLSCNGGGATATFNVNRWIGITADVAGCKMHSPGLNVSGDSTTYLLGPRFTLRKSARWIPFLQFLAGGNKFATETFYPDRKPSNLPSVTPGEPDPYHALYTRQDQTNAFAIEFGGGLDYAVNRAVALHVVDVEDVHTWARALNNTHYPNNVRISTGLVFRFGAW